MKHFVLTRSAYGPEWAIDKNRRRLAITRGVTAKMMSQQSNRDWTWIVLIDERDPLGEERIEAFMSGGVPVKVMLWRPGVLAPAPWDKRAARAHRLEQIAATAYRAPWREAVGEPKEGTLLTRLDDDDALAGSTLERVRMAALGLEARTILMHPIGYRVWKRRASLVRHDSNAMQTLFAPPGDSATVYDYGHTVARRFAPIVVVDEQPAWLWARHRDTISGWKRAEAPFDRQIRALFPVDWSAL